MTYPPSGGQPDPYQPQQPYGQPHDPSNPYAQDPYAPSSGGPSSGQPYPPPYGQPSSGQPYYGPDASKQQYSGPPYTGAPGYGAVAPTNTMAILSLVFAFVFAPAAIVMGHVARKQIRQTGEQGWGLSTAGLWLGYIFTSFYLALCAFYIIAIAFAASSSSINSY